MASTFDLNQKIADILPPDSPYYELARLRQRWSTASPRLGERYAIALNDLGLGMRVAERYAATGRNMPQRLQGYLPFRAFTYLTSIASRDRLMAQVEALWKRKKLFLKAALTARDASLLQIAQWCGTTGKVVVIVMRLYWNIRARWDDLGFMTDLLQLNRQHPVILPGEDSEFQQLTAEELRLVRAAYRHGIVGVFKGLDIATNTGPKPLQETLAELGQEAGRQALAGVLQGFFSVENNGALELLQTLSSMEAQVTAKNQPEQESEDMRMGFGRISTDAGCQLVIKQITQRAAQEKLRRAQEYDAREAAAAEAKRRAAEGEAGDGNNAAGPAHPS